MRRSLLPDPLPRAQLDASLTIVNVVLLLIFFFLATGQLLSGDDTQQDVPTTTLLDIDSLPQPYLAIDGDETLFLNGSPITREVLGVALAGETTLHILIDRSAPATDLVNLLTIPGLDRMEIKLVTVHTGMATGIR